MSGQSVLVPLQSWRPDEPFLGARHLALVSGALPSERGGFQAARAAVTTGASAAAILDVVYGTRGFASLAGQNPVFFGSDTRIYYFDGTAAPVDLGVGGLAGNLADRWNFARFGETVVAANYLEPMQASVSLGAIASLITSVLRPRARYLDTIKTHLLAGFTDDGAGGAVDATRFWWSARNVATDWQPGSNRAGNANVRPGVGQITGFLGFEDFGVLFCEYAVFRVDYVGGDNVWSLRQVGSELEGLPKLADTSVARVGTDIFYWSQSGPAMVRGGESCQRIGGGKVLQRLLEMRPSGPGALRFRIHGSAGNHWPLVYWTFPTDNDNNTRLGIAYNWSTDEWGAFEPFLNDGTDLLIGMAPRVDQLATAPYGSHLGNDVDYLTWGLSSGLVSRKRFSSPSTTLAQRYLLQRWLGMTGKRTRIDAVRLVWMPTAETGTGAVPVAAAVTATITITPYNTPYVAGTPVVLTANPSSLSNQDENGFITAPGLPEEAQFFDLQVDIPGFTGTMHSGPALELVVVPGAAIY